MGKLTQKGLLGPLQSKVTQGTKSFLWFLGGNTPQMGYKMVGGLTGMCDLKRTEQKPGSRMRQVLALSSKDKWVSEIVRQELGEFFWTFPRPDDNVSLRSCLAMMVGIPKRLPPIYQIISRGGEKVGGQTTALMLIMASRGQHSSYITCNFQFSSSLCSSEWAITKAGWPANFSDTITFLWWGSGKLRASGGLLGTTHHTQSPSHRVPFVKGQVSLGGHFPSLNQTVGQ